MRPAAGGSGRGPSGALFLGALALALVLATACSRAGTPMDEAPRPEPPEATVEPELADWAEEDAGVDLADLPGPPEPEEEEDVDRDPLLYSSAASLSPMELRTRSWIHYWQTRGAGYFGRHLERMARYEAIVDRALEEQGLPESLRYLPIVESGYNPQAVSRVGATGLWQLMHPTAVALGLEVGPLVDERRDPVKATEAAVEYLAGLYDQFDSWFLALAAYNAGRGQVSRVIRRHAPGAEPSDSLYIAIREHLPAETQEFVPRFFAAARIATEPERFGFEDLDFHEPMRYDEVEIAGAASLDILAEAAGVGVDELEDLNPQLRRGFTPDDGTATLRVPAGQGGTVRRAYASLSPEERVSLRTHRVESGETLTHVARTHGVSVSDLRAANPGVNPSALQIGQELVVPVPGAGDALADASTAGGPDEGGGGGTGATGEEVVHRVSGGETLWGIARRYGVSVGDLRSWNDLAEGDVLRAGQEITVQNATVRTHEVASGETLSGIAQRYGVSVSELAAENGISSDSVIQPGQELRVPLAGCPAETRRC